MAEWQKVSLGSLAANEPGAIAIGPFGSRMKAELYVPSGVPIIRGVNISDGRSWKGNWVFVPEAFAAEMPNCLTRAGDLVFPHRGSIGEVALVPDDGVTYMISTSLMKFRADTTRVLPEFLLYFFRSQKGREEILRFSSQVGTPGIGQPLASLRQFRVDLPPLPAQGAIAAVLNSLDDKIELNRRMNETLEAMARAIFQDWFVAFGPTRAKMEGRPSYLAPDLWALFPDRLDAEGKPHGWTEASVYRFADVIYGAPFASSRFNTDRRGLPLIRIRDLGDHDPSIFTDEDHPKGQTIDPGDIVVGMDGEFRLHQWKGPRALLNQRVCHFRPKIDVPRAFVVHALTEPLAFFERGKVGTTVIHLGKADIDTIRLIDPGQTILDGFGSIVEPFLSRVIANSAESRILAGTRDLLLPRLMSGELRVKDAERAVEAAA